MIITHRAKFTTPTVKLTFANPNCWAGETYLLKELLLGFVPKSSRPGAWEVGPTTVQRAWGSRFFPLWNLSSKMNCKTVFHDWMKGLSAYRSIHIQRYFIQKYYKTYKLFLLTAEILIQQICFLQICSLRWPHRCICYSVLSWSTLKKPLEGFSLESLFINALLIIYAGRWKEISHLLFHLKKSLRISKIILFSWKV